jgi:hypothetical protein
MKQTPRFYAKLILVIIGLTVLCSLFSFQEQGCGVDRRAVKVLNDTDASKITFFARRAEIADMVKFKCPEKVSRTLPRFGNEFYVYQFNCIIKEYRKEDDGDYHLVLQDAGDSAKTMVGEILNPNCDDLKNNPHLQEYITVRAEFEKCILPKNKVKEGYYKLKGVCFFDRVHGQLGVAKNGVELHPILSFTKFK